MPATRQDERLFLLCQYRRMRLFRAHRGIMDIRPVLPFGDGLGIQVITRGQLG